MTKTPARKRAWRQQNRTKVLGYGLSWRSKPENKIKRMDYKRNRLYGLSRADYDALLLAQAGMCAICSDKPTDGKSLCVDHDHKTGIVRGLLCKPCNLAIGAMSDSPERLTRAADYIEWRSRG